MKDVYDKFGLEATTRDFVGHSMALYQSDEYILVSGGVKESVNRIRLYVNSMARYGKSPYIYPLYGLGELPQGFARLSAIYGGTYMLNTDVDEVLYDNNGKVSGIKATMKERDETGEGMKFETKTTKIIADPSYFTGKAKITGYVIRAICILKHPVDKTDSSDSLQLIIPQSQVGRKHGMSFIYLCVIGDSNILQTSILPWSLLLTTSAPRATMSPLSLPLQRLKLTTTSSWNLVSRDLERLKRHLWALLFLCTSLSKTARTTTCSSPRATMPLHTLRLLPVSFL
jgi:hypothetical protein